MDRKNFLQQTIIGAGGIIATPFLLSGQTTKQPTGDLLPPEKVKEFVTAGYSDLARVKEMLSECPTLLYATWDWGGGDFETALEGAGHVGNKEIANYLINLGARTNLFVLTMPGKTQIVKTWFEAYLNTCRQEVRMGSLSCTMHSGEVMMQKNCWNICKAGD